MTRPRSGRRGNREGTAPFQRSDGRWCAAVSTRHGGRKWLYGRTRKDVAEKLATVLKDANDGVPLPNEKITVGQFLDAWLAETVKPYRKPGTYLRYETAVRLHIKPRIGKVALARLDTEHVERIQNELRARGKSSATIALVRACLCSAMTKAEKKKKVVRNAVKLADAPARQDVEPRVLTPEQAEALLIAAAGHEFEILYRAMLATGLRIGEALGLRWSDVLLDGATPSLNVRQQLVEIPRRPREAGEPKSASGKRTVPLIPAAIATLRAQHAKVLALRLHAGRSWRDLDLVFPNDAGGFLNTRRVHFHFKKHIRKAGLAEPTRCRSCGRAWHPSRDAVCPNPKPNDFTPHSLRHSTGTYLTAMGVPDRVVMAILGHSSPNMTRRYQHVMDSMLVDAAERLARIFPNAQTG